MPLVTLMNHTLSSFFFKRSDYLYTYLFAMLKTSTRQFVKRNKPLQPNLWQYLTFFLKK